MIKPFPFVHSFLIIIKLALFLLQVPKFLVDHPENLLHGLGLDSPGAGHGVLGSRRGGPGPRLIPGGTRRRWRPGRLAAASAVAGGRRHLETVRGEKKKREEGQERRVSRRTGRDAIPSFLRNLHTVLCSGCNSLHSHQQFKWVPFFPHLFQYLLFVDLLFDGHSD